MCGVRGLTRAAWVGFSLMWPKPVCGRQQCAAMSEARARVGTRPPLPPGHVGKGVYDAGSSKAGRSREEADPRSTERLRTAVMVRHGWGRLSCSQCIVWLS